MSSVFLFCLNVYVFLSIICLIFGENVSDRNTTTAKSDNIELKKLITARCSAKYTSNCFLLDLCKVIDRFSSPSSFQIVPGVYVVRNEYSSTGEVPVDVFEEIASNNQTGGLDAYVQKKLNAFLDSLSLNLKIMDRNAAFSVRKLSDDLITELLPASTTVPRTVTKTFKEIKNFIQTRLPNFVLQRRGKKKGSKDAAIWAAGAAAALGTSALFALTGKAAITSLMALLLSLLCYFRGHHGSHYTASGAIVATPYRHQCTEAIIDVNGRNEHTTAILGYKKRTTDDAWNYPRYAPLTDNTYTTEPPIYPASDSYHKMYNRK